MQKIEHNDFIVEEVRPREKLEEIGKLRYKVWQEEGEIDQNMFPDGVWHDKNDSISRHWIVYHSCFFFFLFMFSSLSFIGYCLFVIFKYI